MKIIKRFWQSLFLRLIANRDENTPIMLKPLTLAFSFGILVAKGGKDANKKNKSNDNKYSC